MNEQLTVFRHENVDVVDSREVANMIGRNHKELLRDIRNYAEILTKTTERNFALSDFFIPGNYTDPTNRTLPCYYLTKKGCDMVANKMTGEKGVVFTAAYVTAFEQMRQCIGSGIPPHYGTFSPSLQTLIQHELALQEQTRRLDTVEEKVSTMVETLALPSPGADTWQKTMNARMNKLCTRHALDHEATRSDLYKSLEDVARVNLKSRLKNLRTRMQSAGATKSQISAASRLTVIAADPKLRAIYESLFNKLAASYAVDEAS